MEGCCRDAHPPLLPEGWVVPKPHHIPLLFLMKTVVYCGLLGGYMADLNTGHSVTWNWNEVGLAF